MRTEVYNLKGQQVGEVELSDAVFAYKWNADLVHQVVHAYMANARQPWAHTKGRGEVRGGGKKPWRQKGTGRARHGSTRSPIWIGGGVTHGPLKERSYKQKVNRKMARAALYAVLSKKVSDGELLVVDSLKTSQPKTKEMAAGLKSILKGRISALLVTTNNEVKSVNRASRNIPKVGSLPAHSLNALEALRYKNLLIDKQALQEIK